MILSPTVCISISCKPIEPAPGRMPLVDESPVCLSLADAEAQAIHKALEVSNYNRSAAARLLDIHRSTLLRKMRNYGLGPID